MSRLELSRVIGTASDDGLVSKEKIIMAIFIILMLPLSGMAIDIYTPSLVAISNSFHICLYFLFLLSS